MSNSFTTQLNLQSQMSWGLSQANGNFNPAQQSGNLQQNLSGVNVSTYGAAFAATYSLNAASSTVVNLTSLTNLLGSTFAFSKVISVWMQVSGGANATCTFSPNSASTAQLFFGTTNGSIVIPQGGQLLWTTDSTGDGYSAVTTTQSEVLLNNTSATTCSVTLSLFGA